jgi:hypothetical protein
MMQIKTAILLAVSAGMLAPSILCAQADVQEIIRKSVAANKHDFDVAPQYNFKERDRNKNGDKSYEVTMIDGWPYNRLIGLNGKALPSDQHQQEMDKEAAEKRRRDALSQTDRQQAIQKYQRERERNNTMLTQLTEAFDFQMIGQRTLKGRAVWILKATPRSGYRPPNRDAQVLPGMQGELWIDQKSFQWVRVTAQVIRPVSIFGFLATVEPGTRFELDQIPVTADFWAASHFIERAEAKVMMFFNHREHEDDTFWDYTPVR